MLAGLLSNFPQIAPDTDSLNGRVVELVERTRQMDYKPKRYKVLLYQTTHPDEFDWNEKELYGFLGTRFDSQAAAAGAIAEADEKGTARRTIEYALGNTARIVISSKGEMDRTQLISATALLAERAKKSAGQPRSADSAEARELFELREEYLSDQIGSNIKVKFPEKEPDWKSWSAIAVYFDAYHAALVDLERALAIPMAKIRTQGI
jgi:hypothetical protein